MTTLLTDTFNRADNADLGSTWDANTSVGIGGPFGFTIVSNAAVPGVNSTDECETDNSVTWAADQWAEATLGATTAGDLGAGCGVYCRMASAANTGYRLIFNNSGWELARFNAGAFTQLGFGSGILFAAGDTGRLEVTVSGANCAWVVKKNGTQIASGTDTSPIASGRVGVAYSSTDASATIDSFAAGDFVQPSAILAVAVDQSANPFPRNPFLTYPQGMM